MCEGKLVYFYVNLFWKFKIVYMGKKDYIHENETHAHQYMRDAASS